MYNGSDSSAEQINQDVVAGNQAGTRGRTTAKREGKWLRENGCAQGRHAWTGEEP